MNGYEALRQGAGWLDLSERGKIRATGEDRARLLHAMSTNDVQNLAPGHGLYTFFLNDKGRILADANIYNLGEELFLDTEAETGRKLFEHVDRFIIADDVLLEDETNTLAVLGVEGPKSGEIANALKIAVSPEKLGISKAGDGFSAAATVTGAPGFRLFVPAATKDEWIDHLTQAGAVGVSSSEARVVRIENGTPRYGDEISERYLVQETRAMHAIHSNKGCYLGQEIVERVRSRGQVHRLLTPIQIDSQTAPAAGTKIRSGEADVGEISSAVYSPALGAVTGFAYVRTEATESRPAMTVAGSEPAVSVTIR